MLFGTHTVYVYSYCSYDNSADCDFPSPTSPIIRLEGMDTTLEENDPPSATITGGSLAGSGPMAGKATLQFTATDGGSGVRESQLLVDGSPVITDSYTAQCPYTSFAACPLSHADSMRWNTAEVSDGEHRIALRVLDAAGNSQTVDDHAVLIANHSVIATPPGASQPSGGSIAGEAGVGVSAGAQEEQACAAKGGAQTAVVATETRRIVSGYGRRVRLNGRLTRPDGRPLGAQTLEVLAQPDVSDGKFSALGRTETSMNGHFSIVLAPGPSRTICVRYRATPGAGYAVRVITQQVRVGVKLAVRSHRVGSHGTIYMRGRVLGGFIPAEGQVVELQVYYLGSWRVFKTLRTRPDGRFKATYTFLGGEGTFGFRAQVRHQIDYPFILGASRPISVRAG